MTPATRQWLADQARAARGMALDVFNALARYPISPSVDAVEEERANTLNALANDLDDIANPPLLCSFCSRPATHIDIVESSFLGAGAVASSRCCGNDHTDGKRPGHPQCRSRAGTAVRVGLEKAETP